MFKSKGNKSSGGTRGDPLGSRDSDILEGITKGKGRVGDGLDARGVMYEPAFEDSSQKSGTVVVRICINDQGKVISARYTQKGSTTTDSELINIAVSNSKKYRFSPSQLPEQCGTVSITFIVR
ncbi:MAG: energy transducer TonB [Saprospiraceae bacterium]|nr:energy transducer TonB [Saprospiraceae bacterium]